MIALNRISLHFSVVIILVTLKGSNLDRIKTKIYESLEHKHYCLRRLNDTDQIGCNTKESGSVGIVYVIDREKDLDYVLQTGKHYPYVPVISAKYFNFETLTKMKGKSDRISGVIVLDREVSQLKSHSPDKSCPNNYFDLYVINDSYSHCAKQKWNLVDNRNNDRINENLMFNDWPFPIFLIRNHTNVTELQNCFQRFNKDWPLCAVQLTASSYAAKDAKTCIRRSFLKNNPMSFIQRIDFCKPFAAYNMFSPLLMTNKNFTIADKSLIVLTARLDSFSMFSDISPGADSVITSLVTFLSVVHTLSQTTIKELIKNRAQNKNILFALFDGEALDYIGSSRAVYDMNAGEFPVSPTLKSSLNVAQIRTKHFSHFIELNQLAFKGNDSQKQTLYMHQNLHSNTGSIELQQIIKNNGKEVSNIDFESISDNSPLPPSSLQSFLKDDNSLIGIVIANHRKEYTNRFYNSLYDNFDKLHINESKLAKSLTNIATVISKSIFDLLTKSSNMTQTNGTDRLNITANEELMKTLLQCYLINTNCSLFNTVFEAKDNPNVTFETYVGSIYHSMFSKYTFMILSYFNGEEVAVKTTKECYDDNIQDKRFDYTWIPGPTFKGMCVRSHSVLQKRLSPAFVNYMKEGISNSSLYSTWTQSLSKDTFVRIFVRASPFQQRFTLVAGIAILIISTVIIILLKKFEKQVFNLPDFDSSVSTLKNTLDSE